MKRLLLLSLWLTLTLNHISFAQPFVRLYGADGTNATSVTNPFPTSPDGVPTTYITNAHANISDSATTITLDAPARHVTIWSSSGAANITVTFNGTTPGTSGAIIYGGGSLHQDFGTPISTFKYIGASASGVINYVAQ